MSVVPYTGSRLSGRSYGLEPYSGSRYSDKISYDRPLDIPIRRDISKDVFSRDRPSSRRTSSFIDSFFGNEDDIFDSVLSSTRNLFGHMGMMGSMMRDPFGEDPFFRAAAFPALMGPTVEDNERRRQDSFALSPFVPMMSSMENMMKEGSCHSYSSSSVMTMTTGPDGRPQAPIMYNKTDGKSYNWRECSSRATQIGVGGMGNNYLYQASSSSRGGPGGVRETQRSVADSRTGMRKMAIGHHIDDRSHVIEKEMSREGDLEEKQEFVNLEEAEAGDFNSEFRRKTQQAFGAIEHRPRHRQRSTYLPALPSSTSYRRRVRPLSAITSSSSRTNDRARNRERGVGRTRTPNNPNNPPNH